MNPIAKLRRLTSMTWGYIANQYGGGGWGGRYSAVLQPGSHIDYGREVGDPWRNSAAYVCLAWLARNICEPEFEVYEDGGDDEEEEVDGHPLVELLRNPNPYMTYEDLWKATTLHYATGNAYWIKVRSGSNQVVELYPVPSWMIEPRTSDPTKLIEWYDYRPGVESFALPASEVVHFRNGQDPDNPRKGLSDFAYLMRELFSDNAVNTMIAATSRNMGITGLIVSPADGEMIQDDDVETIRTSLWQRTTGDNAGKPLVLKGAVKVDRLSWSNKEMDFANLRNGPSERIAGSLGLNTMAVNLPSDSKTYSNYKEALESAVRNGLMPMGKAFCGAIHRQLLPDFGDPKKFRVRFEWEKTYALQEDQNAKADRIGKLYQVYQVLTRAEARTCLGYDSEEGRDDVFFAEAGAAIAKDLAAATEPKDQPGKPGDGPAGKEDPEGQDTESKAAEVRHLDPFLNRRLRRLG